jgi:hypothetical protein
MGARLGPLIVFVWAGAAGAQPVVIGFDTFAGGSTSYLEDGFRLESDGTMNSSSSGATAPPAMFPSNVGNLHELTRDPGGTFDAVSIAISELNDDVGTQTIVFEGVPAMGPVVSVAFVTDGPFGFQSFDFPASFVDLVSLRWDQTDPISIAIYDDIEVQPVPEPSGRLGAAVAALGLGLLARGCSRRE